jgi:type II secretory pathway component GspD/PulD (secretin)
MNRTNRLASRFVIAVFAVSIFGGVGGIGGTRLASAQVAVQLPTFDIFSVQTTVMVPDGGTMSMGSIGRASAGSTSRGVPLLGSLPYAGRPFRNRAIGTETSSANVSVSAQIISLRELEGPLLAEGYRQLAQRRYATPPEIQRRAEFLSRNVGTTRR